jgi:hypothetical protein
VQEWYKLLAPSWWDVAQEGEEEVTVLPYEARGIGFYYGHILVTINKDDTPVVEEKLVEKIHLRRRLRGRSFFSHIIQLFVEFRRGRNRH